MTATPNNISPSSSKKDEKEIQRLLEALRAWALNHRGLTDIFLDAYCIVDTANKVVDFNVAFTELCGESYRKVLKIGEFCELIRTELCPGQCPARQIVTSGKPLRLDELKGSSHAFPQLQIILGGIPIVSDSGEILGSLITIRNVSAETELQKKYDERKKESIVDGLTRLFNKVFTESSVVRMMRGTLRESQPLSLVMCDIDHFKHVNDTYGHRAGDYVLATVAQMLKGESRETDVVGRFGGEEFMVVLGNTDPHGALIFSERFRKRVAATQIYFEGKHIPLTVSLGTATFSSKWQAGIVPEQLSKDLIGKADTALYFAKANGRNRTAQAETLPPNTSSGKKS